MRKLSSGFGWAFTLSRRLGWRYAAVSVSLALFLGLALRVDGQGGGIPLDRAVLTWIAERRSPLLDVLAIGLSALGGSIASALTTYVAAVELARRGRVADGVTGVAAVFGSGMLNALLKRLLELPRPAPVGGAERLESYGFPSGHAMLSVSVYGFLLWLVLRGPRGRGARLVGLALCAVPVGVMWSRVYLGVHWPSDVLGGALVAGAWLATCLTARRELLARFQSFD